MRAKSLLHIISALCVWLAAGGSVFAQTWSITSAPVADWFGVASSANGSNLVAVCWPYIYDYAGIYVSTNRGASWTQTSAPTDPITNRWDGVASSADGQKLVAVSGAGSGTIYMSTNGGGNWFQTGGVNDYDCVASSPDGTKLIAGDYYGSTVVTSTNSGGNWISHEVNQFNNSVAISATGTKMAIASGYFSDSAAIGALTYSTNSGMAWQAGNTPTNRCWVAVACSTNGNFMVAAGTYVTGGGSDPNAGQIYVSTNSGVNWTVTSAPVLHWFCLTCSTDGSTISAGALGDGMSLPNAVYTSTNFGSTWTTNDTIQGYPNETLGAQFIASSADGSKLVVPDGYILVNPPLGASLPNLTVTRSARNLVISWPNTGAYTLQQNSRVVTTNWTANTNTVTTTNGTNSVTITPTTGTEFYRLSNP